MINNDNFFVFSLIIIIKINYNIRYFHLNKFNAFIIIKLTKTKILISIIKSIISIKRIILNI